MNTKERILKILLKNTEQYISGQRLANDLKISRNSIWKAINRLKKEGYNIIGSPKNGYLLTVKQDVINVSEITKNLNFDNDYEIEFINEVQSTNNYARELLCKNEYLSNYVIIANYQRSLLAHNKKIVFTPEDTGLYFTIILNQDEFSNYDILSNKVLSLLAETLNKFSNKKVTIKDNYIYINGRKVATTISEVTYSLEYSKILNVILGININLYKPKNGFPIDILNEQTYIFENNIHNLKNEILIYFLENLYKKV